jgi:hypothetical protein
MALAAEVTESTFTTTFTMCFRRSEAVLVRVVRVVNVYPISLSLLFF